MFKSVGIVARLDHKDALKMAEDINRALLSKGFEVVLESDLAEAIGKGARSEKISEMRADFIIVIGGDGTILKTCLLIPRPETPILSINMGRRGFLAEVAPKDAVASIERCIKGEYIIERCLKLSSSIGVRELPDALNEVLITSDSPSKVLGFKVFKNDDLVLRCYSDGIIISTPTGSTAHSLSAGGPVLDPDIEAFTLTPVCPLTPAYPIILPSDATIRVKPLKPKLSTRVFIDGQYQVKMEGRNILTVKKSDHYASFIRFSRNFYTRLEKRLLFTIGGESKMCKPKKR